MPLTTDERLILLRHARTAIAAAAHRKPRPQPPWVESAALESGSGAFVTLWRHEPSGANASHDGLEQTTRAGRPELRGCIGAMVAHAPLIETVGEMAEAAATRDPRFAPLAPHELEAVRIDISVLSPLTPIRPPEVAVGTHGLLIRHGHASGVLLPQVPVEWGWTREEFLAQVCHKAGLASDAWCESACQLYGFTADVFSEA